MDFLKRGEVKRQEIIDILSNRQDSQFDSLYQRMINCIEFELKPEQDVYQWFENCIASLFYKPNHTALCFVGKQAIGKTEFFRRLFPQEKWYSDTRAPYGYVPDLYNHFCVDLTDFESKYLVDTVTNDGFIINQVAQKSDKRLASVCYTSNFLRDNLRSRKCLNVCYIKRIDWIGFNSINKLDLWKEIYADFCSKHKINTNHDIRNTTGS